MKINVAAMMPANEHMTDMYRGQIASFEIDANTDLLLVYRPCTDS